MGVNVTTRIEDGLQIFRLTNAQGAYVELAEWGARWLSCVVPDTGGRLANVIAGYGRVADYLADTCYRGAVVGRFANRIGQARFVLDGQEWLLDRNDGRCHCNHGGAQGFDRRRWQSELLPPDGVRFTTGSPHGEGGWPGNVRLQADYRWTDDCRLVLSLKGTADRRTFLNPTNHAYFNLSGRPASVLRHELWLPAGQLVETDSEFIPTGRLTAVDGTPFDFRRPTPIGDNLQAPGSRLQAESADQLRWNRGYNHCYCCGEARLADPSTGRALHVRSTLPGLLVYTAGFCQPPHQAVCLEAQFWPDAPNHPAFPQPLVSPARPYVHTIEYDFQTIN